MAFPEEVLRDLAELPTTDLKKFSQHYAESCTLQTPLAEAKGRKGIADYYADMRKDIQLKSFRVIDHIMDGDRLCVRWECDFVKVKKAMSMQGVSYVRFSQQNLILSQVDYWNINLRSPILQFAINKLF